jgi:hypothetical protein
VKITSKTLPAGSWAVWGIANGSLIAFDGGAIADLHCELRSDNIFIGGATGRALVPENDFVLVSLSMFGGTQAVAGGSEISLWCYSQAESDINDALIMAITLGGFQ